MLNTIILLHGTSSTGKTSLSHRLQDIFPTPLIYFSLDNWICTCLSSRYYEPAVRIEDIKQDAEVKQGTHFLLPNTPENSLPWPKVGSGHVANDAIDVMYDTIKDFYQKGYSIVIDHVFVTPLWRDHFLKTTADCRRLLVQLTADETTLHARELHRGNRMPNVYKSLLATIHEGLTYDLTFNTSHLTVEECAQTLLNFAKTHVFR